MMTSTTNVRDGDLWTETVRALGIRTTGKRSPFRDLEMRDDAIGMVRDCSIALLLVGLVQLSLSWLAGMGTAVDTLVYMPLAGLLYRYRSRLAALLLLAFSIFAVAITVLGSVSGIDARTDLVLIATLLWASIRAVEATGALKRGFGEPGERVRRSSTPALLFAALGFLVVIGAKFVLPLVEPPTRAKPTVVAATALHDASDPSPAAVAADSGRMRFSPPGGFLEPRAEEPEIATIAEGFVPSAMDLAALYVPRGDLDGFRRDHRFAPERYVMVQTVRASDGKNVSLQEFRDARTGVVAASAARIEKLIGADPALAQWLDAVLRASGTAVDLDGTRIRNDGVLEESERSVSVGSFVETAPTPALASSRFVVTSLVLARGQVLVVYTYGPNAKAGDAGATRDVAHQVVQNLIHENPA